MVCFLPRNTYIYGRRSILWIGLKQIAETRWYLSMLFGVYAGIINATCHRQDHSFDANITSLAFGKRGPCNLEEKWHCSALRCEKLRGLWACLQCSLAATGEPKHNRIRNSLRTGQQKQYSVRRPCYHLGCWELTVRACIKMSWRNTGLTS